MDWFSRYVLSWAVSITMDVGFCLEALDHALELARPEIFNSDQGAQFTSLDFTGRLAAAGIQMSMDILRRAHDVLASDDAVRQAADELSVGLQEIANVFMDSPALGSRKFATR